MSRIKPHPYLKELTCLYVEDEDFIRESFSTLIGRYFKKVVVATNGQEGLEKFYQSNPDIIISDIRMPVMDGIEMVKHVKEKNPDEFVIFITAFTDVEYLKQAIDLGVEGYITKPIDKQKLLKKLNTLAEFLKQKRDINEFIRLLQEIFDKQPNPTILLENNHLKLVNKAFEAMFPDIHDTEKLLEVLPIELTKPYQEITVDYNNLNITFEVTVQKINSSFILITLNDISNLEKQILTDQLTGLYNRKILKKILSNFINQEKCVIIFDIDNFKKINDTYGHNVGDMVLKTLSEILKSSLRKKDIVIRWGGEEFLVILDSVEEIEIAKKIAEMIREKIYEHNFDKIGHITCSFGVYCSTIKCDKDFEGIVNKADKALYKAKENGKNRVEVYKD